MACSYRGFPFHPRKEGCISFSPFRKGMGCGTLVRVFAILAIIGITILSIQDSLKDETDKRQAENKAHREKAVSRKEEKSRPPVILRPKDLGGFAQKVGILTQTYFDPKVLTTQFSFSLPNHDLYVYSKALCNDE